MIKKLKLDNGITLIYKNNKGTPRTNITFFNHLGIYCDNIPSETLLISRLLLQGTKRFSAKELAEVLDRNAIDISCDVKQDFFRARATFLNEDIEQAIDLFSDILLNSTFENIEKEKNKLKGEIICDLDSPRVKALDNLSDNLYKNHPYGNVHTRNLDNIDKVSVNAIKNLYSSNLSSDKIIIVVVGDTDENKTVNLLNKYFSSIKKQEIYENKKSFLPIEENKVLKIAKNDAAQAQVLQAWRLPGIKEVNLPALLVLNSVLGSCGLSSRLFLELREKKGLAYAVRSSCDCMRFATTFLLYIATNPMNIQTCIDGFKSEIDKIINIPISQEELNNAKNNVIGTRAYRHETNSMQAFYLGYYEFIMDNMTYDEQLNDLILAVTSEDIQNIAQQYFTQNSIISLVAPEESLKVI